MAYVDTAGNRDRKGPIAAVIAIHAGLGFVLVSGLSTVIVEHFEPDFEAINIKLDPPTPPDDPKPKPETNSPEQTYTAPKIEITLPSDTKIDFDPVDIPDLEIVLPKVGESDERILPPTLSFDPVPPRPRNSPAGWVTTADYPTPSLRRGHEGLARFRLEVSSKGKVDSCIITLSSGSIQLDKATCRNVKKRARFHPARDSSDKPIAGHYESSVSWRIPD